MHINQLGTAGFKPCKAVVWVHTEECSTEEDRGALDPWPVAAFVWDELSVVPLT